MQTLNYTTIHHEARIKLGLSMTEYAVADLIYHLQNNPDSKFPSWCYASKKTMGSYLGLTSRGIQKIISRLVELGIVERDPITEYLQTSLKWYENAVLSEEVEDPTNNVRTPYEQRSYQPTNNVRTTIIDNNKNDKKETSSLKENKKKSMPRQDTKPYSKMEWLTHLTKDDITYYHERFPNLPDTLIVKQAERAYDWLRDNERTCKNYKSYLRNWLSKTAQNWGNSDHEQPKARVIWG